MYLYINKNLTLIIFLIVPELLLNVIVIFVIGFNIRV